MSSDHWQDALAVARADIRKALGAVARSPMFAGCDVVDLLQQEFPSSPWLITGLVTRGGIMTVGGDLGATKTWIALELATAVATGTKAFGEFYAEPGVAAYFFAEDEWLVNNRVHVLMAGRGDPRSLHLCARGMSIDIMKDDDLAWLIASARQLRKLDLLVLDPLRDISSAAEDSSDEMSQVMKRLRLVATLLDSTVAIVHHEAHGSVIHGGADSAIYLSSPGGDRVSKFSHVVGVELRAARSPGRFMLELAIEDDAQGHATHARWTVNRGRPGSPTVR